MNDREQAARGMMSQGIGSLSGRPTPPAFDRLNSMIGPELNNTAGRRPTEFTQTGEESWKMTPMGPIGDYIEDYTGGRMRYKPYPEMREHMVGHNKGIMNNFLNKTASIPRSLWNEFFGGANAAEINPRKVLESNWAKQLINWKDLKGGMMSPIGYDAAYKKLKNRGDISTWGDLYELLQSGGGTGLTNKVLEKGLGSYASELGEIGMFPKNWSPFQVEPTVESWKGRDYFDVDEGDLEKGAHEKLLDENWLLP